MQFLKLVERGRVSQSQVYTGILYSFGLTSYKTVHCSIEAPKTGPLDYRMQAQRAQVKIEKLILILKRIFKYVGQGLGSSRDIENVAHCIYN